MKTFTRRALLHRSGLAWVGGALLPSFLQRALAAPSSTAPAKVLVIVFQRGGVDGLSMVAPYADPNYYRLRPTLALPRPGEELGGLRLDDHFALSPALRALMPLWSDGALAVVHGVGMPHATRSHFDAQDFLEAGTPGDKSAPDGWLNRSLQATPPSHASAFRAVALQPTLPRLLAGAAPSLAMGSLGDFKLRGGKGNATDGFASLYEGALDVALRHTGAETFAALDTFQAARLDSLPPANGAQYGRNPLAKRLQDIARLIHAEVGLQVAVTDVGGWDTHVGQGAVKGQLFNRLEELGGALAAFATDLGPRLADVCLLTVTEFGRTVRENGNRGTDHGTASVMLALGGATRGGRVYGGVPELTEANLFEARDLPVHTDFRQVFSEALRSQLGASALQGVFPGFAADAPLHLFG